MASDNIRTVEIARDQTATVAALVRTVGSLLRSYSRPVEAGEYDRIAAELDHLERRLNDVLYSGK